MSKKLTPEQEAEHQWKRDNYHSKIQQHKNCEGGPYFGEPLWKHIKKCESQIPEPDILHV